MLGTCQLVKSTAYNAGCGAHSKVRTAKSMPHAEGWD